MSVNVTNGIYANVKVKIFSPNIHVQNTRFDRISFVISISVSCDYVGDSKASELHLIPSATEKKKTFSVFLKTFLRVQLCMHMNDGISGWDGSISVCERKWRKIQGNVNGFVSSTTNTNITLT